MSTALHDLRRTRRIRRLGELEWFEIAYRVYLTAIGGGLVVVWLSDFVADEPATPDQVAHIVDRGPAVLGLVAALAFAAGLRSGSDGGPISIEAGDVRHLLLAPLPRRHVLVRPVAQRMRALGFAGAASGAIAGMLAARRLPGSPAAWMTSGACAGAAIAALFVSAGVLTHALQVSRSIATLVAGVAVGWQAAAAVGLVPGPFDALGGFALWGMRQQPLELIAVAVVVIAVGAAMRLAGRLRIEPLVRRADLVSQLHFAVAVQDLRTVVLLRRQLRGEHARRQPWISVSTPGRAGGTSAVWHRGVMGLARSPLGRLGRMTACSVAAAAAVLVVLAGTTPAVIGVGAAMFLLGLDAFEPLAQEIDHTDRTDGLPHDRGWLHARHLAAPAALLVPFAVIGAAVVAIGRPEAAAASFALALPLTWATTCGAIVSIIRGAPNPLGTFNTVVPPEFAGFTETIRVVLPVAVSVVAGLTVIAVRERPDVDTVVRSVVGLLLFVAFIVWWVRRRDEYRARIRDFVRGDTAR